MADRRNIRSMRLPNCRRRRVRHRAAAWLGVLALLIQLLAPLAHGLAPARAASPDFPWDISDFCLASGHVPPGYAPASGDERPGESQDHKLPPCSICKTLQLAGKCIQPTAAPVFRRFENTVRLRHAGPAPALDPWAVSSSRPRAPPVLV